MYPKARLGTSQQNRPGLRWPGPILELSGPPSFACPRFFLHHLDTLPCQQTFPRTGFQTIPGLRDQGYRTSGNKHLGACPDRRFFRPSASDARVAPALPLIRRVDRGPSCDRVQRTVA